jgi:predicted PurR-regulated permease PerM
MSSSALVILFAVGIVALVWVLNWAFNSLFNKGERAIKNKMAERANSQPQQSQNLADRFKNQSTQNNQNNNNNNNQ